MTGNSETIPGALEDPNEPPPPDYEAVKTESTGYTNAAYSGAQHTGAQNTSYPGAQNTGYPGAQNTGYPGAQNTGYPGPPANQYSGYGPQQPPYGANGSGNQQQQMQTMAMMGAMDGDRSTAMAGAMMMNASQQPTTQYGATQFSQHGTMSFGHPSVGVRPSNPANIPDPNPHLALSIIACILCPQFGIIALIQSMNVKKAIARGDKENGHRISQSVQRMAIMGILVGGIVIFIGVTMGIVYGVILNQF